jgi:hypothetical protein
MIDFAGLQATLDAIADNANDDVDGGGCPHKRFWRVSRDTFVNGEVPNITKNGVTFHIPIVDKMTPLNSWLYKVLLGDITVSEGANTLNIRQMPQNGPVITDRGFTVTVNGAAKTGDEIKADIEAWLTHGML